MSMWWRRGEVGQCSRVNNEQCHRHRVEEIRELMTQSEMRVLMIRSGGDSRVDDEQCHRHEVEEIRLVRIER
jgi:hypothetical protein